MSDELPDRPVKGRGAVSNRTGRFEAASRVAIDDGWTRPMAEEDEDAPSPRTILGIDTARRVVSYNDSPDIPLDRSVNPYRGCEHGCVYCYARPTHAYLGLSPGLDFETRLFRKPDAPDRLAEELRRPGYVCRPIMLGSNTDAWQPVERGERLTRRILEVLRDFRHPVAVITKSALMQRDVDILAEMAAQGLAAATVSVTTLDRELSRRLEPRAATPARRLDTIRTLARAGVPVSVNVAPVVPGLTDHEIERVLEAAAESGATSAAWVLLRLPLEIKELFEEWLRAHVPDRADRVLNLVRDTRGGALYQADFATRRRGTGPYAELIAKRFRLARRRLSLDGPVPPLRTDLFRPPPAPGDQLSLL